jgi:hypothetical protein
MLPPCFDEAVREVVWRHVGPLWLAHLTATAAQWLAMVRDGQEW